MANISSINGNPIVVGTSGISNDAVTTSKIANNSVTSEKIADGAVATSDIASNAVTEAKISDNAVGTAKVKVSAITTEKLADRSVTTAKLADKSVTLAKMADGSIDGSKLVNRSVTGDKIADNTVRGGSLQDGAISDYKLSQLSGQVLDRVQKNTEGKIPWPTGNEKLGEYGQVLRTNGDGTTRWEFEHLPPEESMDESIRAWLNEHPEATTTVQDGALTEAKLMPSFSLELFRCFDTVADMQAATDLKTGMTCHTNGFHASGDGGAAHYNIGTTGTANGMDVIGLDNGLFAVFVKSGDYVTPEMFGAYGNDVADDSDAIVTAINTARDNGISNILFKQGGTYYIGRSIGISNASHIRIDGNGCTIRHDNRSCFVIAVTSHDIEICGFSFDSYFTPRDTETPSNSCIGIAGPSNTALYEVYNINIHNCSFTFGVFGVAATNVLNLTVTDCYFTGGTFREEDAAGGYCILEQSCVNVNIERCFFVVGDYGRHDIYISVKQSKTENRQSKNVYIHDCFSDRSGMAKQESGAYFSGNTVRMAIRACVNLRIDGFYAIGGAGIVGIGNGDGETRNAVIENVYAYNSVLIPGSASPDEGRSAIALLGASEDNYFECTIRNLNVVDAESTFQDINGQANVVKVADTRVNYQIQFANNVLDTYLILENVGVKTVGALSYSGSGTLKGSFKNLYNIGSSSSLACGTTVGGGSISLDCYPPESKVCRIAASATAPAWLNNRLAHPYATLETVDGQYKKVKLPYCTKPTAGILSGFGAGVLGLFYFDQTHDIGESSARLYMYDVDGTLNPNKNVQLVLI